MLNLGAGCSHNAMLKLLFSWSRVTSRKQPGPTKKISAMPTHFPRAVRRPNNVWALHSYHECLVKLGRHANLKPSNFSSLLHSQAPIYKSESSCFCC
nr:hypothetical protein I308_00119 [Cryptococcus tetragattii IND107]